MQQTQYLEENRTDKHTARSIHRQKRKVDKSVNGQVDRWIHRYVDR